MERFGEGETFITLDSLEFNIPIFFNVLYSHLAILLFMVAGFIQW